MSLKILLLFFIFSFPVQASSFFQEQLELPSVQKTYMKNLTKIQDKMLENDLFLPNIVIQIRIYKADKILELWARNKDQPHLRLVETYPLCEQGNEFEATDDTYIVHHFHSDKPDYLSFGLQNERGDIIDIIGRCGHKEGISIKKEDMDILHIYTLEAHKNDPVTVVISPIHFSVTPYADAVKEYNKPDVWKLFCLYNQKSLLNCSSKAEEMLNKLKENEYLFVKENL